MSHLPAKLLPIVLLGLVVLTGCGGHPTSSPAGLVPWTDEQADSAQLAQATTEPTCRIAALRLPASEQRWGGVWNDAVAGYFMIENHGAGTCQLPRPTSVRGVTDSGERVGFGVGRLPDDPLVLGPGDRAQVQVSSPYDCGRPLARSTSFVLAFPTGALRVRGAAMAVQCGGSVTDFSTRSGGASMSGLARTTPTVRLRATLSRVPERVSVGGPVSYVVTLTNPTSAPIPLTQCPSYQEGIKGEPSSAHTYRLNCDAVRSIPARSSVHFAMRLQLPDDIGRGAAVLDWKLQLPSGSVEGGRFASASTTLE